MLMHGWTPSTTQYTPQGWLWMVLACCCARTSFIWYLIWHTCQNRANFSRDSSAVRFPPAYLEWLRTAFCLSEWHLVTRACTEGRYPWQ